MELKILVLANGKQLIGKTREENNYYILEKWGQLALVPVSQNDPSKFAPLIIDLEAGLCTDTSIKIDKMHVLYALTPNSTIENEYISQTSGIITNPGGGISLPK